jgi:hypothetical protein
MGGPDFKYAFSLTPKFKYEVHTLYGINLLAPKILVWTNMPNNINCDKDEPWLLINMHLFYETKSKDLKSEERKICIWLLR